ncbi:peptide-methionine (R)-S-oxide reductase MsrB [Parasphingorhabdus sp.]|uniref:peptide-methionine (R)-S-oxide reductase MsrB n=1 Tax=Parasphingorhabdus sp. TaxID=2709688 RepID=UPI003A92E683
MKSLDRRTMITGTLAAAGAFGVVSLSGGFDDAKARSGGPFKINRSPEEWKQRLGPARYRILRLEGTERAYSSSLNDEKRNGVFACAGCNLGVYSSKTKYNSRTGWPSFWAPISNDRIGTTKDFKLVYPRTEVHCARCGGHLGHIFNDGPKPTGKRHCINGLALRFIPA